MVTSLKNALTLTLTRDTAVTTTYMTSGYLWDRKGGSRINTEISQIQTLLTRKAKADALPPEIRKKYAEDYNRIVSEIVQYGLTRELQAWDDQINSEILSLTLRDMASKYEHKKPYVEWMCQGLIPEVDESFKERDQGRFFKCIQVARAQLNNV